MRGSDTHHPESAHPEGRWNPVPAAARRLGCLDNTVHNRIRGGLIAARNPGVRQTVVCPGCLAAIRTHGLPVEYPA